MCEEGATKTPMELVRAREVRGQGWDPPPSPEELGGCVNVTLLSLVRDAQRSLPPDGAPRTSGELRKQEPPHLPTAPSPSRSYPGRGAGKREDAARGRAWPRGICYRR